VSRPWFDPETGILLFDEYVVEMPSFQKILEDSVVTDQELLEQAQRVNALFRDLETRLPPEAKELATEALCELSVLSALHHQRMQAAERRP
jgi:hypothetical protein